MEQTLRTFVDRYNDGEFIYPDRRTQIEAGWFDWWCKTSALAGKTRKLGKCVASIVNSNRFDAEKTYVFFKNNCPAVGPLYDQFSICDLETGEVLFCCQHLNRGSHGCERAHWEVYAAPDFHTPAVSGTWAQVRKWFNA